MKMPNLNPKQMQKMMKQLGMQMDELDAEKVEILLRDGGVITITEPQIVRTNIQGKDSFQVTGNISEGGAKGKVSEEDLNMVVEQTGASVDSARSALESEGDLARAILKLEEE